MNEVWNLDPIYKGFDDPAFAADMQALSQKVKAMGEFAGKLQEGTAEENLRVGIRLEEETSALAGKLGGYSSLRQATNTRDPEAGSRMGQIMSLLSGTAGPRAAFREWASKLPNLMELVREDEFLAD